MVKNIVLFFFVILIGFLTIISCNKNVKNLAIQDLVIYPSPPDTTRIQYLTSITTSDFITGNKANFFKFIVGSKEKLQITKPHGLSTYKSKVFICDTGIKGLVIIDFEKSSFITFIPQGKGELKMPIGCTTDNNGYLYVADRERQQVVVFDEKGLYVNAFGEQENFVPTDVFVSDDKIWVTNSKNNKISVYKKGGSYDLLFDFPEAEAGTDEHLYTPISVVFNNDKVYVTDFGDFKIKIFDKEGKFISTVGSYGKVQGQFVRPKGIAVDKNENLYVVDAGFENAQIFNKEGNLLMHFGGSYKGHGDMYLPFGICIQYDNLDYFQKFVDISYNLKYLIFITNQYGPDKLSVYGFVENATPEQIEEKQNSKNKRKPKGKKVSL
ncbi:MAG: hypothetical protein A2033_06265 [Bacteroidetes bacterium GWA2_31_9]|nr:MAG: hypothetical protein A2033_06265 [Bacteroidetes bacterium GWA2_31_9]